jgi:hypothetical protein
LVFEPGKYYIGDLCYVINNENWDKLLNDTEYFQNEYQEFKGQQIFACSTVYGDGIFYDNNDTSYPVDAGILGIMPYDLIDDKKGIKNGSVVTFDEDFEVFEENGIFTFGNIEIDTN